MLMTRMVYLRVAGGLVGVVSVDSSPLSLGESSGLVQRCECLECCPSEWRTALDAGERKCPRPPARFEDGFFSLTWMASLTPLSNQRSSLSSTRTWLSSKACPLSFRCRCTAESCPEEVARLYGIDNIALSVRLCSQPALEVIKPSGERTKRL